MTRVDAWIKLKKFFQKLLTFHKPYAIIKIQKRKEMMNMAKSVKALNDAIKATYVEILTEFFKERGEEVLRTASNEICFPVVDEDGNEKFVQLPIKVPTGSRDGDAFDGYAVAEDYAMKQAEKAEKAKTKAEKAEKDKAKREAKKAEKKGE